MCPLSLPQRKKINQLKSDLVHSDIPPRSPPSFTPSSQQKTTAAENKSVTTLGIPARRRQHLDKICSNSRDKGESQGLINAHG